MTVIPLAHLSRSDIGFISNNLLRTSRRDRRAKAQRSSEHETHDEGEQDHFYCAVEEGSSSHRRRR